MTPIAAKAHQPIEKMAESQRELIAALLTMIDHAEEFHPHFVSPRGQADIAAARAAIKKAKSL